MVDFRKLLENPPDRVHVTYRCERCGEVDEYSLELPPHMLEHYSSKTMRRCGGRLVEVSRRTEARERGIVSSPQPRGPGPTAKDQTMSKPEGMTIEDFMNHSTRGGGGRGKTLRGWKEKGAVTVWLSCQASIYTLWRHGFYRCEPRENKDTKEKTVEVWQDKLVCFETEEDLKKRFWRDKQTGEREYPPKLCPDCLMIEDVYQKVERGEIDWLEPLFVFRGTDSSKDVVLHAGGLFNAFGSKDLTAEQKAAMAKVTKERGGPIYAKNAWRENLQPKMEYVYVICDHEHPEEGLRIAVETSLLGDKMKTEIAKQMTRQGPGKEALGNPILHPYPFRWEYNSAEGIAFDKKYDATALDKVRLTPAIEKLIRDTDPPDVSGLLAKPNLATHRARLEKYAVGAGKKLPFDDYFREAFAAEKRTAGEEKASRTPEVTTRLANELEGALAGGPAPSTIEEEVFGCDNCGEEMKASETVCKSCGQTYDVQPAEPPPPPKRELPKRSEARKAAAAPGADPPRGSLGAAAPPEDDFSPGAGEGDDDIPFAQPCDIARDSLHRRFRRVFVL